MVGCTVGMVSSAGPNRNQSKQRPTLTHLPHRVQQLQALRPVAVVHLRACNMETTFTLDKACEGHSEKTNLNK